jgi:hypothetical protein
MTFLRSVPSKKNLMMINPRSLPDNRPSVENVPESTYPDEVWGKHCEVGLGLHEPNSILQKAPRLCITIHLDKQVMHNKTH